jgi:hypothetical protein
MQTEGLLIINWILSSIKTNPTNSFLTAIWEKKKNNKIWRSESNQTERGVRIQSNYKKYSARF